MNYECCNPDCPNFPEDEGNIGPGSLDDLPVDVIAKEVALSGMTTEERDEWVEKGLREMCAEQGITKEEFDRETEESLRKVRKGLLEHCDVRIREIEETIRKIGKYLKGLKASQRGMRAAFEEETPRED